MKRFEIKYEEVTTKEYREAITRTTHISAINEKFAKMVFIKNFGGEKKSKIVEIKEVEDRVINKDNKRNRRKIGELVNE